MNKGQGQEVTLLVYSETTRQLDEYGDLAPALTLPFAPAQPQTTIEHQEVTAPEIMKR